MLVYLASTSPRRRQLLTEAGFVFACVEPGPEPDDRGEPRQVAVERARRKCVGARVTSADPGLVLGVDTVVDLDGVELGKPRGRDEARRMLLALQGREHDVHTAHCLRRHPEPGGTRGDLHERLTTARVRMRALTAAEVEAYLATEDWRDKAGGYGIQSRAADFCSLIAGTRATVVGLDVETVAALCRLAGAG